MSQHKIHFLNFFDTAFFCVCSPFGNVQYHLLHVFGWFPLGALNVSYPGLLSSKVSCFCDEDICIVFCVWNTIFPQICISGVLIAVDSSSFEVYRGLRLKE